MRLNYESVYPSRWTEQSKIGINHDLKLQFPTWNCDFKSWFMCRLNVCMSEYNKTCELIFTRIIELHMRSPMYSVSLNSIKYCHLNFFSNTIIRRITHHYKLTSLLKKIKRKRKGEEEQEDTPPCQNTIIRSPYSPNSARKFNTTFELFVDWLGNAFFWTCGLSAIHTVWSPKFAYIHKLNVIFNFSPFGSIWIKLIVAGTENTIAK